MKTRIFSIAFLIIALALGYYLVTSIKTAIDDETRIKESEALIIERLMLIRDAEKAYQTVYGKYTSDWDTLINFVEHGQFPITKRTESIIQLAYGADSSVVTIDTLEIISARDYIFIKKHNVYGASDGVFGEYLVTPGQYVVKGSKIYSMVNNLTGKKLNQIAKYSGRVSGIIAKNDGEAITKGDLLFVLTEEMHDPNIDVSQMPYIPFTDPARKFDIYAERIERNRLWVNVVEVRDVSPINPLRSEENEANNKKPLRFGSRTEVTTAGNWE